MSHPHAPGHPWYHGHPYCWYWFAHYPLPCAAAPAATCTKLVRELLADATTLSQDAFVGGLEDACLSLEFLKTGAAPSVQVSITDGGSTMTWSITAVPAEYQIKEKFAAVSPGATIKLDVVDCTARLRWCESVSC